MLEKFENEELTPLSFEEKQARGILGRLTGPVADFINPTRNGRVYDESLWEKVFEDPIVKEHFEMGGITGELDHPQDRLETCSEKIAIIMPEPPKKDKDGHLIATFDILDTPNGRIAYTLAKYGYKLGISSRGGGDVYQGVDGQDHVDEDTYDFQGFDLVLLPAVKAARLKMVESLQSQPSFKQAICEALDKATPDDKKVMTETLTNLNIDFRNEEHKEPQTMAASNPGATVVKELQEALLKQQALEQQITSLQEKLSVCYAKEAKYEEDISKYKYAIRNLSESASNAKALQTKLTNLQEELAKKDSQAHTELAKKERLIEAQALKAKSANRKLTESIAAKNLEIAKATKTITQLKEQLKAQTDNEAILKEELAETKKDHTIKAKEYSGKLTNANKLIEQYRRTAKTAVSKFIEVKANLLGVSEDEIKNKLPSNYSFNDIETVCESLSTYKLNIGNLPFSIGNTGKMKATIKEGAKSNIPTPNAIFNDDVDDDLLSLAKLH